MSVAYFVTNGELYSDYRVYGVIISPRRANPRKLWSATVDAFREYNSYRDERGNSLMITREKFVNAHLRKVGYATVKYYDMDNGDNVQDEIEVGW